jgi:hypothetical protein
MFEVRGPMRLTSGSSRPKCHLELYRDRGRPMLPEMNAQVRHRLTMEHDLRRALERQQSVVHYHLPSGDRHSPHRRSGGARVHVAVNWSAIQNRVSASFLLLSMRHHESC